MIADRIAIYSVLLPLFILSPSGLSPPQRLPQWLRSSKRAMDDGRRERRGPPFSPLFPLLIAPRALSFFLLPSLPTTQREESPHFTVPYSSVRYLSSVTQGQFVGSGETSFCRAVSQDPTHCPWVSDDVCRERFVVRVIRQYQGPTTTKPRVLL